MSNGEAGKELEPRRWDELQQVIFDDESSASLALGPGFIEAEVVSDVTTVSAVWPDGSEDTLPPQNTAPETSNYSTFNKPSTSSWSPAAQHNPRPQSTQSPQSSRPTDGRWKRVTQPSSSPTWPSTATHYEINQTAQPIHERQRPAGNPQATVPSQQSLKRDVVTDTQPDSINYRRKTAEKSDHHTIAKALAVGTVAYAALGLVVGAAAASGIFSDRNGDVSVVPAVTAPQTSGPAETPITLGVPEIIDSTLEPPTNGTLQVETGPVILQPEEPSIEIVDPTEIAPVDPQDSPASRSPVAPSVMPRTTTPPVTHYPSLSPTYDTVAPYPVPTNPSVSPTSTSSKSRRPTATPTPSGAPSNFATTSPTRSKSASPTPRVSSSPSPTPASNRRSVVNDRTPTATATSTATPVSNADGWELPNSEGRISDRDNDDDNPVGQDKFGRDNDSRDRTDDSKDDRNDNDRDKPSFLERLFKRQTKSNEEQNDTERPNKSSDNQSSTIDRDQRDDNADERRSR